MAIQSPSNSSRRLTCTVPPDTPVSFLSVWLLGLALGLTACTITCLPFMGTWALGRSDDSRACWFDTLSFLAGRLFSYIGLGGLAGALGAWFVKELANGFGNLAIGIASLIAATWLAWPASKNAHAGCSRLHKATLASPFLMGISLTLIPCAPLSTLLATCAAGESFSNGALYGAAFGCGTVLTPMLLLIPASAGLGKALRTQAAWLGPWIRYGAAAVLLMLGMKRLFLIDAGLALVLATTPALLVCWAQYDNRSKSASNEIISIKSIG